LRQICSICHWKIEPGQPTHICTGCKLPFHPDCWEENKGCSAYGCTQVGVLDPEYVAAVPQVPEAESPPPLTPFDALQEHAREQLTGLADADPEVERAATVEMAAAVLGSLLGILAFGAPALLVGVWVAARLVQGTQRGGLAIAALLVSLVGAGAGGAVSYFWWLM
jgi:hypothetical protein